MTNEPTASITEAQWMFHCLWGGLRWAALQRSENKMKHTRVILTDVSQEVIVDP